MQSLSIGSTIEVGISHGGSIIRGRIVSEAMDSMGCVLFGIQQESSGGIVWLYPDELIVKYSSPKGSDKSAE